MPHHDATLFPLPADADALLGANPTFTLVDELGVIDAEVFETIVTSGKRAESTLLAIGTPPREADSVMRTLVEHGRVGDDPTLALIDHAADPGTRVDDQKAWKQANPPLGDFLYADGMATEAKTVRESTFRQFRLGQWVGQPDEVWMPAELWASCASTNVGIPDGGNVVLPWTGRSRRIAPPSSRAQRAPTRRTCSWPAWAEPERRRRHVPNRRPGGGSNDPRSVPPMERPRDDRRPKPLD
jgi:phage terminase large subunit-like protein